MTSLPINLRYERKFVVPGHPLESLLARARQHPAMFREVYAPRLINNIYLDSPGLQDYHAHVSGLSERVKTRVRWYGPLSERAEVATLERKAKSGLLRSKLASPLPGFPLNGHDAFAVVRQLAEAAAISGLVHETLRQRQPSLVNQYRRRYFLSADRRFRLTVDSDLRFLEPRRPVACLDTAACAESTIILELKFAPEDADAAIEVAGAFPFRLSRYSKYVVGLERISG